MKRLKELENNKIAKRVYDGVGYVGRCPVGRLQKRVGLTLKNCSKKRGMDVGQLKRMVHGRN